MIRETFGGDEVAEENWCVFEIDIRLPGCIVERIFFPLYKEFVVVGIRGYIKLLL